MFFCLRKSALFSVLFFAGIFCWGDEFPAPDPLKISDSVVRRFSLKPDAIEKGKSVHPIVLQKKIEEELTRLVNEKYPNSRLLALMNKVDQELAEIRPGMMVVYRNKRTGARMSGKYTGQDGVYAYVGSNRLLLNDFPEFARRMDVEGNNQRRQAYLKIHYYDPKGKFIRKTKPLLEKKLYPQYAFLHHAVAGKYIYLSDYVKLEEAAIQREIRKCAALLERVNKAKETIHEIDRKVTAECANIEEKRALSRELNRKREEYLARHLGRCMVFRLNAYMIYDNGGNEYEIANVRYSTVLHSMVPTSDHAILKTRGTRFESKGHFSLPVYIEGYREVRLKQSEGNFRQKWTVYIEASAEDKKISETYDDYKREASRQERLVAGIEQENSRLLNKKIELGKQIEADTKTAAQIRERIKPFLKSSDSAEIQGRV